MRVSEVVVLLLLLLLAQATWTDLPDCHREERFGEEDSYCVSADAAADGDDYGGAAVSGTGAAEVTKTDQQRKNRAAAAAAAERLPLVDSDGCCLANGQR